MDKTGKENKKQIMVGHEKFVEMITAEEINNRVTELGKQITEDYKGRLPIFIGVLNGSFMFLSDLIKHVDIHCEIDFIKLSSYGDTKISSGNVKTLKELNADINERHVIIVEDIVDTGLSISYLEKIMKEHNPASVKIASFLVKPGSLKYDLHVDYKGFDIPNEFVIGYGLDYAQKYRNLNSIYALSE
jgi:hypoxanthine phosphoribosyltransferase